MNSDLTPVQSADSTNNPQSAQSTPEASDAKDFQQSAGIDVLKQNIPLHVETTGQPISIQAQPSNMSGTAILFIIVSSLVLLMIASSVFRWVMKRPDKPEPAAKKNEEIKPAVEFVRPLGKKKLPRSKRRGKK